MNNSSSAHFVDAHMAPALYRVEFGPYYSSIVPTGIFIYIISIVYFIVKGLRKGNENKS